jgi:hypothetical protein
MKSGTDVNIVAPRLWIEEIGILKASRFFPLAYLYLVYPIIGIGLGLGDKIIRDASQWLFIPTSVLVFFVIRVGYDRGQRLLAETSNEGKALRRMFSSYAGFKKYMAEVERLIYSRYERYFAFGISFLLLFVGIINDYSLGLFGRMFGVYEPPWTIVGYLFGVLQYAIVIDPILLSALWAGLAVVHANWILPRYGRYLRRPRVLLFMRSSKRAGSSGEMWPSFQEFENSLRSLGNLPLFVAYSTIAISIIISIPAAVFYYETRSISYSWYGICLGAFTVSGLIYLVTQSSSQRLLSDFRDQLVSQYSRLYGMLERRYLRLICDEVSSKRTHDNAQRLACLHDEMAGVKELLNESRALKVSPYRTLGWLKLFGASSVPLWTVLAQIILQRLNL